MKQPSAAAAETHPTQQCLSAVLHSACCSYLAITQNVLQLSCKYLWECVLNVLHGAKQVQVGSQLPNVQLVLPSAAHPEPESFVMTQDLFNGACCPPRPPT